MNNLRLLSPGPAQRAASEIKTTMNGIADGVREMSATLDELRAEAKSASPPVDKQTAEEAPPEEAKSAKPPPDEQAETKAPESHALTESRDVSPPPTEHDHKRSSAATNSEKPRPGVDEEGVALAPNGKLAAQTHESLSQSDAAFLRPAVAQSPSPDSAGAAAVHPSSPTRPAPWVIPPIPNLQPQMAAFISAVVRNQEMTISLLQKVQPLIEAHAAQISQLKREMAHLQNIMSNLRRF